MAAGTTKKNTYPARGEKRGIGVSCVFVCVLGGQDLKSPGEAGEDAHKGAALETCEDHAPQGGRASVQLAYKS